MWILWTKTRKREKEDVKIFSVILSIARTRRRTCLRAFTIWTTTATNVNLNWRRNIWTTATLNSDDKKVKNCKLRCWKMKWKKMLIKKNANEKKKDCQEFRDYLHTLKIADSEVFTSATHLVHVMSKFVIDDQIIIVDENLIIVFEMFIFFLFLKNEIVSKSNIITIFNESKFVLKNKSSQSIKKMNMWLIKKH
jgi:hypothetical protein